MNGEQTYYLAELVRLVFSLLPIALILIATTFLRRQQRTRRTLFLQLAAAFWLLTALTARLVSSRVVGLGILPKWHVFANEQEVTARMDFYFKVTSTLHIVEQAAFILFAVALLLLFRRGLRTPSSSDATT